MNRNELKGWKKIFSFTFIQHYKSKASVIGLIVMCVIIMCAGPLMTLMAGSSLADKVSELGDCKVETLYIKNDTGIEFNPDEFTEKYPSYGKIKYIASEESSEQIQEKLDAEALKDLFLYIHMKDDRYCYSFFRAKDSEISSLAVSELGDSVRTYCLDVRMRSVGLSEENINSINAEKITDVVDYSELSESKNDSSSEFVMVATTIYACVVMMIVLISSQQISVSIVTEKSSKVIETLLLSVRPLAIIVGKITGTMAVLFCNTVLFIICGCISGVITSVIAAKTFGDVMQESMVRMSTGDFSSEIDTASLAAVDVSPLRVLTGIVFIIVTTILAYLLYAVISGINGASCTSMDDLQSASAFISITTVIGVYLVMGAAMADNPVLTRIAYLFPFSGIYMVPIEYIMGRATLLDVMIIWAEVIVLTVILFRFAANIYHVLVYHNGERLKLKNLIEISKAQKGRV